MPKCSCEEDDLTVENLVKLFGYNKMQSVIWDVMNNGNEEKCGSCNNPKVQIK